MVPQPNQNKAPRPSTVPEYGNRGLNPLPIMFRGKSAENFWQAIYQTLIQPPSGGFSFGPMAFSPSRFRQYRDDLSRAVHSLSAEAQLAHAMKYRITEPTFFLHKDRKPGETLEAPVGPFRYEPTGGGLKRTAQFEEINERTANLNKFSMLSQRVQGIHKKAHARADGMNKRLDVAEPGIDRAFDAQEAMLDDLEKSVKDVEECVRDMPGANGTPLLDSSEG